MQSEPSGRDFHVLLVEDDTADVVLTREVLHGIADLVLTVVSDGAEAISLIRRRGPYREAIQPDLVLLDLNLPKAGGRRVLAEIKADPGFE